jgi:hypothetical protein
LQRRGDLFPPPTPVAHVQNHPAPGVGCGDHCGGVMWADAQGIEGFCRKSGNTHPITSPTLAAVAPNSPKAAHVSLTLPLRVARHQNTPLLQLGTCPGTAKGVIFVPPHTPRFGGQNAPCMLPHPNKAYTTRPCTCIELPYNSQPTIRPN